MINDYHIHTRFSHDSDTEPAELCARAQEMGLSAIGFSEHADFDPKDPMVDYFDYDKCEAAVNRLRRDFPKLDILFGIEIDYRSWLKDEIADFLRRHPFDYTIGSVHYIVDYLALEKQLENRAEHELYTAYFREVAACAAGGLFDILGHADYIKRVAEKRYGPYAANDHAALLAEIIDAVIANEMALESNTKGLRSGLREPYPNYDLLELYAARGGRKVILGSDAHNPEELCCDFDQVAEKVKQMGLELWEPSPGKR